MSDNEVMEVVTVPQVQMGDVVLPAANDKPVSGEWSDFAQDLANIAAEQSKNQPQVEEVKPTQVQDTTPKEEPAQPPKIGNDQPTAAPATPEAAKVPDKFLNPDGSVDQDRLLGSYIEAEKALKRAQQKKPEAYVPQPAAPVNSFEAEIEADLQKLGPGKTLAKLFDAARQAGYADAKSELETFVDRFESQARTAELKAIGAKDPWVFTDQGFSALKSIRESNPWVNQAPDPWKTAYLLFKGQSSISASPTPQVQTPTPKAVTAPPAPATAAVRTQPIRIDDPEALKRHLAGLTKEQETKFWDKFGLRY